MECILPDFLYYFLQYLWVTGAFNNSSTQTTNIANINNTILSSFLIPLPSLFEQKEIVTHIEEFELLVSQYKLLEQQAKQLDTEFPDKLKK
jgi:type I restriction enzyme S subunit